MTWLAASRSVLKPGESARESPTTPNEAITAPTRADLEQVFRLKNGDPATWGWSPRLRFWLGYFTPDEYYEALIAKLVREGTAWIELGCGRHILPYNQPLARMLAWIPTEVKLLTQPEYIDLCDSVAIGRFPLKQGRSRLRLASIAIAFYEGSVVKSHGLILLDRSFSASCPRRPESPCLLPTWFLHSVWLERSSARFGS